MVRGDGRRADRRLPALRRATGLVPRGRHLALRALAFDPADHGGFAFDAAVTRKDAADTLNAAPPLMMAILADELAHAGVGGTLLDREAVAALARSRISAREILVRFCGGGRRLPEDLRRAGSPPRLGPAGWERSAVERLLSAA